MDYTAVVGAYNVDITGIAAKALVMQESNIGDVIISPGGVSRNICENLGRLDVPVKFISIFGKDGFSKTVFDSLSDCGVDYGSSVFSKEVSTSFYISLIDSNGDMKLALNDMKAIEKLSPQMLEERLDVLLGAKIILADCNLSSETLEYLSHLSPPLFLEGVSAVKVVRIKNFLQNVHTIKINKNEAIALTGMNNIHDCAKYIIDQGTKRVFITMGEEGSMYYDGNVMETSPSINFGIINASGAGDAYFAGVAYAYLNGLSIRETLTFSSVMAALAMNSKDTVNGLINKAKVIELAREFEGV